MNFEHLRSDDGDVKTDWTVGLVKCGLSLAGVLTATLAYRTFPLPGEPLPFAIFSVAVVLTAWYRGLTVGLLATALGTLVLTAGAGYGAPSGQVGPLALPVSLIAAGALGSVLARFVGGKPSRKVGNDGLGDLPHPTHLAVFAASYFLAGGLGQGLAIIPGVFITFWPPTGILVAALLLNPRAHRPGYILAAGLAELACNDIWFRNHLSAALIYYSANALEALTAAWLIDRICGRFFRLESIGDVAFLAVLGGGVAPVVGATLIAGTDALLGKHPFLTAWPLVWLGDGAGLLVSTPVTFAVVRAWRERAAISARRLMEALVLVSLLVGTGALAFRGYLPTAYVTMPLVLWAAVRFQFLGAAVAVSLLTVTCAALTGHGVGEFTGGGGEQHTLVVMLQAFLAVTAFSAFLMASLSFQHHRALSALVRANRNLERRVEERTAGLRASEGRLRLAADAVDGIIYEYDVASGRVERSRGLYEVLGFHGDEVPPTSAWWWEQIHPDDRTQIRQTFTGVGGNTVLSEYRVRHKDGRWLHVEDRAIVVRDSRGNMVKLVGCTVDVSDRKKAEQELRESEELLRRTLDTAAAGLTRCCRGLRYQSANPAYATIVGLPVDRIIGRPIVDVLGAAAYEVIRPHVERVLSGERVEYEAEVPFAVSGCRYIHVVYTPEEDGSGNVVGWVASVTDITDRRRGELELERVAATLNSIIASAPVGVVLLDAEMRYRHINEPLAEINGLSAEAHIGKTVAEVVPDLYEQVKTLFDRVLGTGQTIPDFVLEGESSKAPGVKRWWRQSWFPVAGPDGKPSGVGAIVHEITEHKLLELERENSRRTFATLIERCPFGIYLVDADFRIASVNVRSQDRAFANVRPLIGRPFDEAMRIMWPEPVATECIEIFRHTLDTGDSYSSKDFVNPRADTGRIEGYEWELHRITLPNGRYGVVCYYFDATMLRQVEQALKESDRKKDEFLATLAHELRNPLAPIRNGIQIMKLAGGNADAVERSRGMIERQVAQMAHLIDDLMDLSRINQGKIGLQKLRMQLADAIRDAVDTSRPLIERQGHELELDVPNDPIFVEADQTRLTQVFANLLNNAAKYTERGGRILLSVEKRGDEVCVSVSDNGVGIPADMLPRVFDMFAQVDGSLEKSQGGLGIGLSIVKKLVEMHNGWVRAESGGHGRGSTFTVSLPVVLPLDVQHEESPLEKSASPSRRILVVDDNPDGATSLAMMLEMMGNETEVAHDGLAGVMAAETFRPDVILMDIGMPGLNGYDAARRIRAEAWSKGIVMVAQTGWGQSDDKQMAADAGFDLHMTKPVDPAALHRLLGKLDAEGTEYKGFLVSE